MKTNHTPGPWKLWNSGYANAPYVLYAGDNSPYLDTVNKLQMYGSKYLGEISSQVLNGDPTKEETWTFNHEANAKLIASAPELLEALKEVTDLLNTFSDEPVSNINRIKTAIKEANAAITKATN